MRFLLNTKFDNGELELTSEEFDNTKRAYFVNQRLLAFEEKYFLILQNYAEFERTLHELALASLVFGTKKWTEHVNDIQMVNGRLLNLLSSTKAYLDQAPQHLNDIFGDGCEQSAAFQKITNDEFDAYFGYRVMSAVRNHAQHSDFPVRWVEHGGQWETDGETKKLCRHHATALISVEDLVGNSAIRAATRKELSDTGKEQLNVKLVVRQYLSSMARLHMQVRQCVEVDATRNEEVVRELLSRFERAFQCKPMALTAVAINRKSMATESVPVFVENIDRRNYLVKHCRIITNMELHCISGEI
ncbi:MAG: hypothetical protein ACOH2B_05100 [Burkholderiaceae bacterium]